MSKRRVCNGVLSAVLLAAAPALARADEPEEIARRCVERVDQIADRAITAMRTIAGEAVRRIEELQQQGDDEGARHAAVRAAGAIRAAAAAAFEAIHDTTARCVREIREAGGSEELIRRVVGHSRQKRADVRDAAHGALRRIREALED
jgi:hypothetical protein